MSSLAPSLPTRVSSLASQRPSPRRPYTHFSSSCKTMRSMMSLPKRASLSRALGPPDGQSLSQGSRPSHLPNYSACSSGVRSAITLRTINMFANDEITATVASFAERTMHSSGALRTTQPISQSQQLVHQTISHPVGKSVRLLAAPPVSQPLSFLIRQPVSLTSRPPLTRRRPKPYPAL